MKCKWRIWPHSKFKCFIFKQKHTRYWSTNVLTLCKRKTEEGKNNPVFLFFFRTKLTTNCKRANRAVLLQQTMTASCTPICVWQQRAHEWNLMPNITTLRHSQMALIFTARTKLYFHVYYILVFDVKYIKITLTEDLSEEYLFFTKQFKKECKNLHKKKCLNVVLTLANRTVKYSSVLSSGLSKYEKSIFS